MVSCPECQSSKVWKDGLRYVQGNPIQRYICRDCGFRFSDPEFSRKITNSSYNKQISRQICVTLAEGAKNLVAVEKTEKKTAGEKIIKTDAEIKGKLIEYLWYLKKQGYRKSTIEAKVQRLERLFKLGANLFDPESVKETIANDQWRDSYKAALTSAYQSFTEMVGIDWKPPRYKPVQKLPFVPHEREIDALIAGTGRKVATTLQLLKETGMRIGEAWNLEWTDVDKENHTITCTPEKHGTPRQFKVSSKLIGMLNALPKIDPKVFGNTNLIGHRYNFTKQRSRIAKKLQNPRIKKISFHTLRHWKATMEYHKTKDILHVMQMLGHRQLSSTMVYTHLVKFENNDFHVKTAKTLKEACELAKAGFTFFTKIDGIQIFRRPK